MAGVVRFFRDPKNNKEIEYKTGKIKILQYQEFKYYEILNTDVAAHGLNLFIDNQSKTIVTSYELEFNTSYIIILADGYEYVITAIHEEVDPDDNNFFNIKPRKRTYLTIIRDR